MILGRKRISALHLISNRVADGKFPEASFDLTVGTIVSSEDDTSKSFYILPPQGIVKVVSQEHVTLPDNVMGYVHVKTALCNQGILALNIGIVDPRWSGPLQSVLLNFGKVPHRIRKGEVFGRITFHETDTPERPSESELAEVSRRLTVSLTSAVANAQSDVDRNLAADFLNFSKTVTKVAKKVTDGYRNTLFLYLPAVAIILTILTFLLNFSNMYHLESYIKPGDRAAEDKLISELNFEISQLRSSHERLVEEVQRIQVNPVTHGTKVRRDNPAPHSGGGVN